PIGTGSSKFEVNNFPCRASPFLLVSHVSYLKATGHDTEDLLVNRVATWLVEGGSLATKLRKAKRERGSFWMPLQELPDGRVVPGWQAKARAWGRFLQWAFVDFVLTILALLSLHWLIYPLVRTVWPNFLRGQPTSSVSWVLIETAF